MPYSDKYFQKKAMAVLEEAKPKPPMHPLPEDYEDGKEDADYKTDYAAYLVEVDAHCEAHCKWLDDCNATKAGVK